MLGIGEKEGDNSPRQERREDDGNEERPGEFQPGDGLAVGASGLGVGGPIELVVFVFRSRHAADNTGLLAARGLDTPRVCPAVAVSLSLSAEAEPEILHSAAKSARLLLSTPL